MNSLRCTLTVPKLALGMLLVATLPSCLIHGEVALHIFEQTVTTDATSAALNTPISAQFEIRGGWLFGATAAYAVAEGRMELCIAQPTDNPNEYCRSAPAGQLPPGVTLLPNEVLGKDFDLRLDRRNRDTIVTEAHTVQFTSSVPQELVLMTRYTPSGTDRWALDPEGRQTTVTFRPED